MTITGTSWRDRILIGLAICCFAYAVAFAGEDAAVRALFTDDAWRATSVWLDAAATSGDSVWRGDDQRQDWVERFRGPWSFEVALGSPHDGARPPARHEANATRVMVCTFSGGAWRVVQVIDAAVPVPEVRAPMGATPRQAAQPAAAARRMAPLRPGAAAPVALVLGWLFLATALCLLLRRWGDVCRLPRFRTSRLRAGAPGWWCWSLPWMAIHGAPLAVVVVAVAAWFLPRAPTSAPPFAPIRVSAQDARGQEAEGAVKPRNDAPEPAHPSVARAAVAVGQADQAPGSNGVVEDRVKAVRPVRLNVACDEAFLSRAAPVVAFVLDRETSLYAYSLADGGGRRLPSCGLIRYGKETDRSHAMALSALLTEKVGLTGISVAAAPEAIIDGLAVNLDWRLNAQFVAFAWNVLDKLEARARNGGN